MSFIGMTCTLSVCLSLYIINIFVSKCALMKNILTFKNKIHIFIRKMSIVSYTIRLVCHYVNMFMRHTFVDLSKSSYIAYFQWRNYFVAVCTWTSWLRPANKTRGRERESLFGIWTFWLNRSFPRAKMASVQCSDVNSFSFLLRKEDQGNCANHTEEMGTESRGTN